MIQSMTAYARIEHKAEWGTASWEIRSVNQRYLETYLRLPEQMRSLEPVLRDRLRKRLNRGKVEVNLRYELSESGSSEMRLNQDLAKQLLNAAEWLKKESSHGELNLADILRWPGVMSGAEQDMGDINKDLLVAFDGAVAQFIEARGREGEAINTMLQTRLDQIVEQVAIVREHMPAVMQWQRDKLTNRLAEITGELDPARMEQEMVLLAQKMDVAEEMDRLDAHVAETRLILKKGGAQGRRLDFMMQEFNRESNTLASKSISAEVTAAAVELKVLIEQMREQIQNVE
ncbi:MULTISPECIES: YicC/YloC family endoribonuclease [unclassified Shewanella]|uniref:YicC/YloC family endoribonuclease n=1 Tax=unclassified Shewanella TaxID=196818 RepID=UPI000C857395|nr:MULTISPECIES: YicC/YloC family endoribonuclease [unclassified Shewanella]MDO6618495.1 YicC/YloC family endoribonuclease [Shewanella sp. 6_MG-2023]MDO6640312.1 YicC/YloC family endoribonuclease [Shewanella sp. 5_MG-2023]MDO6680037.1 YicC/YloC family endoribonuclease [Shewanella sp. 4_MG-2023]MDO6774394.1 YicC/YloC family endoribonuclease [Shewanella sp. 3_MG-2023]PMG28866.1 YicC family protein [Shewanella sp. 10N.286.52.C2]